MARLEEEDTRSRLAGQLRACLCHTRHSGGRHVWVQLTLAMKLKDLAAELGLSQTTVSRALNGFPEVNEATRQRVSEAARRLGYRANVAARRLATGRSGAIGVALPLQRSMHFGPHVSEFLSGVSERLAQNEIDLVVAPIEKVASCRSTAALPPASA